MKVDFTDNSVIAKGILSKKEIPFSAITNAYLRIEEIQAKVCCGRANFDRYYLVLVANGKEEVMELESRSLVEYGLEKLKEKVPGILIGKR